MKLRDYFYIAPSLLVILMITSACSKAKPLFKSDEKMKSNFQENKSELLTTMKRCRLELGKGSIKYQIRTSFEICRVSPSQLRKNNVLEVAERHVMTYEDKQNLLLDNLKKDSFLFVTDQNIESGWGTYVEEKGYIFSTAPIKNDVITKGSLDQFRNTEIEDKSEKWRFIPIELNWYLYYRQYRYSYP